MKKIFIIWSAIAMMGCKNNSEDIASTAIEKFSPAVEENSVIYEVNIRQYSPEGTFNAFTKDMEFVLSEDLITLPSSNFDSMNF